VLHAQEHAAQVDGDDAVEILRGDVCGRHPGPLMLKGGGGAIVNTSSGAGVKGFAGQIAYAATKYFGPRSPSRRRPTRC
jgi:NAD(P)-dependent dehydrogenase (short-subunit alcohol dehydrogenase family)